MIAHEHVCNPNGCPPDDVAHLKAEARSLAQENIRLRDQQSTRIREDRLRNEAARSAARRAAWDAVLHQHEFFIVAKAQQPFWELIRAARVGSERASTEDDKHLLANAAHVAEVVLRRYEAEPAGGVVAELRRLRDAINGALSELHEAGQMSEGGYCVCLGCRLIRKVWDAPIETAADHDDINEGEETPRHA